MSRTELTITGTLLAVAGITAGAALPAHPNEFLADALLDPRWIPVHGALMLSFLLSVPGVVGLWLVQRERLGSWGHAAFLLALFGSTLSVAMVTVELCVLPGLAAADPKPMMAICAPGGPVGSLSALFGAGFATWIPGWMAVGVATHRARVLPRPIGLAIAATSLGVAVPVHLVSSGAVAHAIAGMAFGAAWLAAGLGVAGLLAPIPAIRAVET